MTTALLDRAPEQVQSSFTVLVVDDHELIRLGLGLLLSRQRWVRALHCARSGAEAVELAGRHEPLVAVVAVRMGEESGFDLCGRIRTASPATQVLVAPEAINERTLRSRSESETPVWTWVA
jgi:two-component system, NarL family, nitrate/nitrite response regulator NarP